MDYFLKQTNQPLFADLMWSRPENRMHAGKLLIVSGSAAGFAVAGQAYVAADRAGAGTVRVVLPELLRSSMPKEVQFELEFAPSVAHGSFSKKALNDLLMHAHWADAVLLPGGIGRNSETSVLLDQFVQKQQGLLVVAEDALDIFVPTPKTLFERDQTVVVADFSQLQKMWHKLMADGSAVTFDSPLQVFAQQLTQLTQLYPASVITLHQSSLVVATGGKVSVTASTEQIWRITTASSAAVWAMQNPTKLFESLTTAVYSE